MTKTRKPKLTVIDGSANQALPASQGSNEFRYNLRALGLDESIADIKICTGKELPQSEASKMADAMLEGLEALAAKHGSKLP